MNGQTDDKLMAVTTTRGEQHMEVVFAILPALEFIKDRVFAKRTETLGAYEA